MAPASVKKLKMGLGLAIPLISQPRIFGVEDEAIQIYLHKRLCPACHACIVEKGISFMSIILKKPILNPLGRRQGDRRYLGLHLSGHVFW
jgi:hypothetical protein